MRTNILHLIPSLDPKAGGMCQAVRSMISYSKCGDYTHEVLCLDDPGASYVNNEEFRIYALGKGKSAWNYHSKLKSWLDEHVTKYEHVVVHGLWQYQSRVITQVVNRARYRHINLYVMPHGMLDPYFQQAPGRSFKAIRNLLVWHFVERKLVARADFMLFTCEKEKELAKTTFTAYSPKKEVVIGLGVGKPPIYQPKMMETFCRIYPEAVNHRYLLYLGRIDPKKGVDVLIKAYLSLKAIKSHLPKLVIAGPGLETRFGQYVSRLAGGDRDIYFTGMLSGAAKWGAFYGCEAFVLPSHQENFGVAVVEAMACAKAVLISDQVNICWEISAAKAGLVHEDTEEGMLSLLQYWSSRSAKEKETYGLNAKAGYEKFFAEKSAGYLLKRLFKKEGYE